MADLFGRITAKWKGEVEAGTLEAFRRAGSVVYSEFYDGERLREALVAAGENVWVVEPAVAARWLCGWNAFVAQTIGENLMEADYADDPRTSGYLPSSTYEQVEQC